VLVSLCPITGAVEQLAEAKRTVGGERAHAELVGPGECMSV
jgi:hypothetical protein